VFEIIYISIYAFLGVLVLIGFKRQFSKSKLDSDFISLDQISVVIPFRNEAQNLEKLIESINQQSKFPNQIIFVNDHSEDNGKEKIKGLNCNFSVIDLPENRFGKKEAIRFAISNIKNDYILTLDSDIELNSSYFMFLEKLSKKDLLIFPVIMKGANLCQKFYELDYALSNAMNTSVSGLIRPFLASGANLLFNRSSFLKFDSYDKHRVIASGDDLFLLNDFRRNNCSIELMTELSLSVSTAAPLTLKEFISQRLRWIGKGNKVGDQLSNGLAIIVAMIHIGFSILLVVQIIDHKWIELILFVGLKMILELIVYYPYFNKINRLKTWAMLPFSTFIYPIYIVVLMVLLPVLKPKWKNRK
jgi:cellulose synthase/poly-beta-1,6-N-acetylglucosamine synthase-like glycosyltransferase